uniref:Exostosin domain-containing protein n=1 Tax=Panagrellus redivivus TaxID=6233 RepID=A0A7E5A1N6_PANRE
MATHHRIILIQRPTYPFPDISYVYSAFKRSNFNVTYSKIAPNVNQLAMRYLTFVSRAPSPNDVSLLLPASRGIEECSDPMFLPFVGGYCLEALFTPSDVRSNNAEDGRQYIDTQC